MRQRVLRGVFFGHSEAQKCPIKHFWEHSVGHCEPGTQIARKTLLPFFFSPSFVAFFFLSLSAQIYTYKIGHVGLLPLGGILGCWLPVNLLVNELSLSLSLCLYVSPRQFLGVQEALLVLLNSKRLPTAGDTSPW